MNEYTIRPVARIRSDYKEKFGIPKQCGLVNDLEQAIVFEPEFSNADALRDIGKFDYIWLIWGFSENLMDMSASGVKWSPTARPPRLGGNKRVGVWASRSPYRPNSLGLSSVKLIRAELGGKPVDIDELSGFVKEELALIVSGADLMDGTPVFDIKPYLPYSDSHPEASSGYSTGLSDPHLTVVIPDELLLRIDAEKREGLLQTLSLDPRGAYEKKQGYTYGMSFADWDIRFTVEEDVLTVSDVILSESGAGNIK